MYRNIGAYQYILYQLSMTLSEYIESFPRDERNAIREEIAARLGCGVSSVRSYANGWRTFPTHLLPKLPAATRGNVRPEDQDPAFVRAITQPE